MRRGGKAFRGSGPSLVSKTLQYLRGVIAVTLFRSIPCSPVIGKTTDSGHLASGDSSPDDVKIGPLSRSLSHRQNK